MADRAGPVAALPRSRLHLQFLLDNAANPDVVLFRDETMRAPLERHFAGRLLYLGRETLPGRGLASFAAARRANRAYYPAVAALLAPHRFARTILFLEGEPLERFLQTLPGLGAIELWEDGLSHYVDLTSNRWYAARGLVQAAAGFYPRDITRRRIDRGRVTVRDRFERRNLVLHAPAEPVSARDELLLIGSPLVEDRIVGETRFRAALAVIAAASPRPVRYLPHPREDVAGLARRLAATAITLEPNPEGLIAHAGRYRYTAYAAAVSTGLIDLGRYERSLFVPGLFGLRRMARVLRGWPANPVTVVDDGAGLRRAMAALPAGA
ncbi:hypothetical protein PX554_21120 [Sphingomonas sp. H39-1-10]|uniref:hypothetical protein n=1 Tax=Sphingomonas pollutisoli TaxID=3030829 RepID=UPI0023B956B0|nr:hypothetical protein [Sphingomonas pollutisoli]MDF0490638.1 hypothetical protein [Sphingomonas pollutisoli]